MLQQRIYLSNSHRNYTVSSPPVQFVVNGVRGIRLSDALLNRMHDLEDGESTVLSNSGQKVTYRLEVRRRSLHPLASSPLTST